MVQNIEQAIIAEWFSGYASKQLSRLAMGRLLGQLSHRFDESIAEPLTAPKIGLYACHDTTLAGALKVLRCFDDRWPFFTAYLSFELLKKNQDAARSSPLSWMFGKTTTDKDHFVRVKYNTNDMFLPACAPPGKHLEGTNGSVCTCERLPMHSLPLVG